MDTPGKRIAALRRAYRGQKGQRLSQAEAAKALGVARNTLSAWETDAKRPSSRSILKLAAFFGIPADYILSGPTSAEDQQDPTPAGETGPSASTANQPGRGPETDSAEDGSVEAPFAHIGQRIAELRRAARSSRGKRMTQSDLAEEIGAHRKTVAGWESGRYRPAGDFLGGLADALGTTVQYILTGEPSELASRLRLLDFEVTQREEELDSIADSAVRGLPPRRTQSQWQAPVGHEAIAPHAKPSVSPEDNDPSNKGEPPAQAESRRRPTVVLLERDVAALDRISEQIRERTGTNIQRSGIIRALVRALAESGFDVAGVRDEEELIRLLKVKLAT